MDSHSDNIITPETEAPREDTFIDDAFSEKSKTPEQHYNSAEEFLTDLPRRLRAIADGTIQPTEDNLLMVNSDARKLNISREVFREHCEKFIEDYKGGFVEKIVNMTRDMTSADERSKPAQSREDNVETVKARKEAASKNFSELRSDEEQYRSAGNYKLLPVLNFLRENKLEKLDKAIAANTRRENKIARLDNKIQKLTARCERLAMTNAALTSFFNGSPPKPIRDIIKANEQKIERINTRKIPDRYKKIEGIIQKVERGSKKIELLRSETNKLENLSALIKSFAVLDNEKRRAEFTRSLDGMRSASRRSLELRVEKIQNKIEGYNAKLMSNDYSPRIPEKIFKAQKNMAKLTAKLEKLNAVKLPFAALKPETVDKVMDTAKKEVERYDKSLENTEAEQLESVSDFADDLCEKCGEALPEQEQQIKSENEREFSDDIAQPERDGIEDLMYQMEKNMEVSSAGKEQMKAPAERAREEKSNKPFQIIGNTNYDDIQDKYYANLTPERAREVSAILAENGIAHSGVIYEYEAKITLDKSDEKAYRQLTSAKREQTRESSDKEQTAKNSDRNFRPQKRNHEQEL